MKWDRSRESDNVVESDGGSEETSGSDFEPRRLSLPRSKFGILGLFAVVIVAWLFGINPIDTFVMLTGGASDDSMRARYQSPVSPAESNDPQVHFVKAILGSTEDVWTAYFRGMGREYEEPKLELFNGRVASGCGLASEAMGPFYCPADHRVYLDLDFFREMEARFRASGDFARAYVIGHEVGHHVQQLLGVGAAVDRARRGGQPMEGADGLSVRLELQADCFAGVWAHRAQQQLGWLETGDVEAALNAAEKIGDDALQKQSQGYVVPDSFTHGTSAQRVQWFKSGFSSGAIEQCDTFK